MHCGVFTGSYGVIGVEFPKDEVGLLLYGTEDVFYSSYTHKCKNGVCVCACYDYSGTTGYEAAFERYQ